MVAGGGERAQRRGPGWLSAQIRERQERLQRIVEGADPIGKRMRQAVFLDLDASVLRIRERNARRVVLSAVMTCLWIASLLFCLVGVTPSKTMALAILCGMVLGSAYGLAFFMYTDFRLPYKMYSLAVTGEKNAKNGIATWCLQLVATFVATIGLAAMGVVTSSGTASLEQWGFWFCIGLTVGLTCGLIPVGLILLDLVRLGTEAVAVAAIELAEIESMREMLG